MNIRPMVEDDHDDARETLTACGVFNAEEIRVALEMVAASDEYTLFGADVDRRVRGFVCVGKTPLTLSTWYLYWICVHPQVQGTGVGLALHAHAERFIRTQGGERLVLETSSRTDYERARHFYRRTGYRPAGRVPDFYRRGDDCLIWCKLIA